MQKRGICGAVLLVLIGLLFPAFQALSEPSHEHDLILRGGLVIDGTGRKPFFADAAVRNGIISAVWEPGKGGETGAQILDIRGKWLVPGFIDIHTHCDNLSDPQLKAGLNYLTQGVTTVVSGNCGSGTFQVEQFFQTLEKQGVGMNVIHLVGHGRVRSAVMGGSDRGPSPAELEKMMGLVEKAMREGASGLSSGLFYAPGSYASTDEVIRLLSPVKKYGGYYSTHLRDESNYNIGLKEAVKEAVKIGETTGIPVQISHLKALGKPVWGQAEAVVEIIESAQNRGVKVFADQYPYTASSTSLAAAVIPRWVQAGGKMRQRLQDPAMLEKIKPEIAANIERRGGGGTLVMASYSPLPEWEGNNLGQIAALMEKSEVDTAVELILTGNPSVVSFNMTEEDVEFFMRRKWVMTGSDGSSVLPSRGIPHPRNYGTFPRKIRVYALQKKILSPEQAVRAATGLPAEMLGLHNRGRIKKNMVADIVVIDPEKISDLATFSHPHQYSRGIDFVIIAGKMVIENGRFTGVLAGKPIRKKGGGQGH